MKYIKADRPDFTILRIYGTLSIKFNGLVKSHKSDATVKSFRCKARKSLGMRRTYQYAAVTKDEAQRRRWTFYEAVKFNIL